jgi:hypothetical protein
MNSDRNFISSSLKTEKTLAEKQELIMTNILFNKLDYLEKLYSEIKRLKQVVEFLETEFNPQSIGRITLHFDDGMSYNLDNYSPFDLNEYLGKIFTHVKIELLSKEKALVSLLSDLYPIQERSEM